MKDRDAQTLKQRSGTRRDKDIEAGEYRASETPRDGDI